MTLPSTPALETSPTPDRTAERSAGRRRSRDQITKLLRQLEAGREDAAERLFGLLYDELHLAAERQMRLQPRDHTLQPTALVHEAFLKLMDQDGAAWQDRRHFLAVAARAMRSILVDHARAKGRIKRTPGEERVPLDLVMESFQESAQDLVALDDALEVLAEEDARTARVVELRFFGGLSVKESAAVLGCSVRTVERSWTLAKAWLHGEIRGA